jgi:hypothetical protein
MGHWRFQKRIGNKFLKLNVSKTGFSVTGGVPGAHVNADLSNRRKKMFMNTFSLPGSGLSYRTSSYGPERGSGDRTGAVLVIIGLVILAVLLLGG